MTVPIGTSFACSTLMLALLPASTIWALFYRILLLSVDLLDHTATRSLADVADPLQQLLLYQSKEAVGKRVLEGELAMSGLIAHIKHRQIQARDIGPSVTPTPSIFKEFQGHLFGSMLANKYFSYLSLTGAHFPNLSRSVSEPMLWWQVCETDQCLGHSGVWDTTRCVKHSAQVEATHDEPCKKGLGLMLFWARGGQLGLKPPPPP